MKKTILIFIIWFVPSIKAQNRSYYGWIYEGEGVAISFCIKIQNNQLVDTLYLIHSLEHNIELPLPGKISDWKNEFQKHNPFKIKIVHIKKSDDNYEFTTDQYYFDENSWISFSFNGRVKHDGIKGTLVQKQCNKLYSKNIYVEKYEVKLTQ